MSISVAGYLSCKQLNTSKEIDETEISDSLKHIHSKKTFNHKDIYNNLRYIVLTNSVVVSRSY